MYSSTLGNKLAVNSSTQTGGVVIMARILEMLFGCAHKRYSFPMTRRPGTRRSPAAAVTGTYVVCLDCGKEFAYDWQEMKLVDAQRSRAKTLAANAAESLGKSA